VAPSSRNTVLCRCLACLVCLALAGCASTAEKVATKLFAADQTLVFDRTSDLLPPENLRITSNADREISLAWEPVLVGDVAGYAILRGSGNAEGAFHRVGITSSRFGTVFTDEGDKPGALGDGQTYTYRVHPYDRQGRVSRSHAALTATTEPRPAIPESLQVYSNLPRKAVLSWKPSEQVAVSGYGIYRCPTMAGPWERVSFAEGRLNSVYEDTIPGDLRVMYYRISAVNRFGGESEMTAAPIRGVTKAEPLPPTGLSADARRLGRVALEWAQNVEPDVRSYEVWRSEKGGSEFGPEARIATVDAPKTAYADAAVGCGETVRYRLRARDADGLESFHSEPLEVTGLDLALAVQRTPDGLVLRWDPTRGKRFASARVSQLRSVLPDKELANVSGVSEVTLPDLAPGTQLEVALSGPIDGGDAAPGCRIAVPSGS
jgi:fibronectin type 3 domain-containing protein